MKSNQSARKDRGDKGEVGIGTMIVFIAAVIVAAIAAAVLVNTAGNLERKASETGDETTQEVSGNLFVRDIVAGTNVTDDHNWEKINEVNLTVSLAPGADPIDMETMHIQYQDNQTLSELSFNAGPADSVSATTCSNLADGFCVLNVQEEEGTADNVLETGDIVHLSIALDDSSHAELLETRVDVSVTLMPEEGAPVDTGFTTPNAINTRDYIVLK
jgi:flagellin FlaB